MNATEVHEDGELVAFIPGLDPQEQPEPAPIVGETLYFQPLD